MKKCPTPTKVTFPTKGAALTALRRGGAHGFMAYRCRCGSWHTSSSVAPKGRRTRRR